MERIIKFALVMLLAVLSIDATFGQVKHVGAHLVSAHLVTPGLNNVNPGVYIRLHNNWSGGVYHNSYRQLTKYVAYNHDFDTRAFGRLTLTAGLAHGYDHLAFVPMLAVSKRFGHTSGHGVRTVAALPEILHLAYEYEVQR